MDRSTAYGTFEYWVQRARDRCNACYETSRSKGQTEMRDIWAIPILEKAFAVAEGDKHPSKEDIRSLQSKCNSCYRSQPYVAEGLNLDNNHKL